MNKIDLKLYSAEMNTALEHSLKSYEANQKTLQATFTINGETYRITFKGLTPEQDINAIVNGAFQMLQIANQFNMFGKQPSTTTAVALKDEKILRTRHKDGKTANKIYETVREGDNFGLAPKNKDIPKLTETLNNKKNRFHQNLQIRNDLLKDYDKKTNEKFDQELQEIRYQYQAEYLDRKRSIKQNEELEITHNTHLYSARNRLIETQIRYLEDAKIQQTRLQNEAKLNKQMKEYLNLENERNELHSILQKFDCFKEIITEQKKEKLSIRNDLQREQTILALKKQIMELRKYPEHLHKELKDKISALPPKNKDKNFGVTNHNNREKFKKIAVDLESIRNAHPNENEKLVGQAEYLERELRALEPKTEQPTQEKTSWFGGWFTRKKEDSHNVPS